ncbi:DNA repair exonuclease [Escherichia phage Phagiculus]
MATAKISNEQLREELANGMTNKAIAEKYGMNIRNVELRRSKLAKAGELHGNPGIKKLVPDGYMVKGTSTMIDAEGNEKIRWVKTSVDNERLEQLMEQAREAFCSELPKEEPVEVKGKVFDENTLAMYPVFDLHIGAMAHKHECGENYDTATAEKVMNDFFDYAVNEAPNSKNAVLVLGGDLIHYDSLEAKTPASGHILDSDSRYAKIVYVCIRSVRRAIRKMLEKHQTIDIKTISGNHDESGMVWLRAALAAFYEDEPRVTVDVSPAAMMVTKFGSTLIGYTHGHQMRKAETRLTVMATDWRRDFGVSDYVYTHSGHWHSQKITETNLGIDEVHGQLGSPDAYSANGGWRSQRQAAVIIYHKEFGEVGRFICRPKMFTK